MLPKRAHNFQEGTKRKTKKKERALSTFWSRAARRAALGAARKGHGTVHEGSAGQLVARSREVNVTVKMSVRLVRGSGGALLRPQR